MGKLVRFDPAFRLINYPYQAAPLFAGQMEFGAIVKPSKPAIRKDSAYELLRRSLPFDCADLLAPFQSHQWNLIRLLSMKRRFDDLLHSNPVLAYYLANNGHFMTLVYRKAKMLDKMTGESQVYLLKLLELPAHNRMVRIIKKMCPCAATPLQIQTLRICARDPDRLKKLSHLQQINYGALELAAEPAEIQPHITPQLLEEVSADVANKRYAVTRGMLRQTLDMHKTVSPDRAFPCMAGLEPLRVYHQQLQADIARTECERQDRRIQKAFTPPIAGTENIQPLGSPADVKKEGWQQRNCVGRYDDRYTDKVFDGSLFLYRVLSPERATLSIVKGPSGEWQIGELESACNAKVSAETRAAVEDWLRGAQVGI